MAVDPVVRFAQQTFGTNDGLPNSQGPGYRDFAEWLPPRFGSGQRQATEYMPPVTATTNRLLGSDYPAEFLFGRDHRRRCPVFLVLDSATPWIRVAKPFPKQFGMEVKVHTNDHRPEHIHIVVPPGNPKTVRYLWPSLEPYPGGDKLSGKLEKKLARYIAVHGEAIDRKVAAVEWQ